MQGVHNGLKVHNADACFLYPLQLGKRPCYRLNRCLDLVCPMR